MTLRRLPAVFMRGGTSKAVVFRAEHLPADRSRWDNLFLQVMGSPDPYGRQLDGMGGGLSSLSKVCIVAPPSRPDADVDYTFAQVAIDSPLVDYSGNCGNMSAAIGPFAVEEGLVAAPGDGEAVVRIHNTNTGKIIVARFPVIAGALAAHGDLRLDGVAGSAAPIRLEFVDPGGAGTGRLLPSGAALDHLHIPHVGTIAASCVDAANPCVFVTANSIGKGGTEHPDALAADGEFLDTMERIRRAAAVAMGLATDFDAAGRIAAIPKVAMVSAPADGVSLSGEHLAADDLDIVVRMISVGQPHRAVPITGAICLAVAARIPGSLPNLLCRANPGPLRIGHPSGTTLVDARVTLADDGTPRAELGAVYRSARRLFEGQVVYRASQPPQD